MAELRMFDRGFSLRNAGHSPKRGGGKRGCLTGAYSSASFRRLREFVITHTVDGLWCQCWGITLTVPGLDNVSADVFKSFHHKLCNWANKWKIPLVWRVELQRRGMPHLHLVLFGTVQDCVRLMGQWYRILAVEKVYSIESFNGSSELLELPRAFVRGASHAVDLQILDGSFSAFRYLVAHMSKGKVEQLGFAGRNWGVCSRSRFTTVASSDISLDNHQYYVLLRWLRRWTRRRIYSRRGCSFWVSNPFVVSRMAAALFSLGSYRQENRGSSDYWLYSWFALQFFAGEHFDFLQYDLILSDTILSCEIICSEILQFMCNYLDEEAPF